MTACRSLGCDRRADIKDADLALCARHYKAHIGWTDGGAA